MRRWRLSQTRSSSWGELVWLVFLTSMRAEIRERIALTSLALFSLVVTVTVSYGAGTLVLGGPKELPAMLLWVVLLFGCTAGLDRAFVKEEDSGTAVVLRLVFPPSAVWVGKMLFNCVLLVFLFVLSYVAFKVLLGFEPASEAACLAVLGSGVLALASGATTVAALVAKARSRGVLFSLAALPLLLPAMLMGIVGTVQAVYADAAGAWAMCRGLIAFAGLVAVASLAFFGVVWDA